MLVSTRSKRAYLNVLIALLLISHVLPAKVCAQDIFINEVMASNATTISDDDGDYEDWIELYNAGEDPVDLTGFGLSDDYENPFRWIFPETIIQPGEFLLVWASGKDRSEPGMPLHTNFRIAHQGEEVLITHYDGTRLDELLPTFIPTDVSYGRKPDGPGEWYYFSEPTPSQANETEGYYGLLEPPEFSQAGGFYDNEFELNITHPDPEVTIIYALDGSKPCIDNLDGTKYYYKVQYPFYAGSPMGDFLRREFVSKSYNENINILDRSDEPNQLSAISTTVHEPDYLPADPVFKGMVVRARAYKEGMLPSDISTHTYFVSPEGAGRYTVPVIALSIQENKLFDYNIGIYTPGEDADQWRKDNPNEDFRWPFHGNFRRRGVEWEYPLHIELFDNPNKQRVLNQDIGFRIHGGATRSFPMKSIRLYARNQYTNSTLSYNFFDYSADTDFKRLILRNSGNDFPTSIWAPHLTSRTMFRDAAIQAIFKHMNFDTQAYTPSIIFINGEYWGIQNIRERYDKHYLERVYGVDQDNIDLLSGRYSVKEGDNIHYVETIDYIEEFGLQEDEHYQYIKTRIDVENFIDYQIANIYAHNTDWPGNNIDFWRLRTDEYEDNSEYGHDGRWRWLMFDTDFGFGLWDGSESYTKNTLAFATQENGPGWPNPDWSTFLLRSFLKNEQFKIAFINRFADQLNTGFLQDRAVSIINELKDRIAPEIDEHFARWGMPNYYDTWENHVSVMTEFAKRRPFYQRQHIINYFGLNGRVNVTLDVSNQLMGHVRINTIEIEEKTPGVSKYPYPWEGIYFKGVPVEIEAIAAPGYRFSHWEGTVNSTSAVITLDKDEDIHLKAHFEKTNESELIHYWLFDTSMPNNTPLETLDAFYSIIPDAKIRYESCLEGYPFEEGHANWRKASMERRNNPTPINYRPKGNEYTGYDDVDMRGLQVRQPFFHGYRENTLILDIPTTGFSDIVLRFAAKDEGAANKLIVDYCAGQKNNDWTSSGLTENKLLLGDEFQFYEVDFKDIVEAINNPYFKIRVRFGGSNLEEDDGNRVTFNNISLDGTAVEAKTIYSSAGNNGSIEPEGQIPVFEGSNKEFHIKPDSNHVISSVIIDGEDITHMLLNNDDGGAAIYEFENVIADYTIHADFSLHPDLINEHRGGVIIYPNPADYKITISSISEINQIDIVNVTGQLIDSYKNISSKDYHINTSFLEKGFYIVVVYTKIGVVSKKLNIIR